MANYCLSCCSTVDLTPEHMRERDIRYVCFHFTLDGVEYPDDMGVSMSSEERKLLRWGWQVTLCTLKRC